MLRAVLEPRGSWDMIIIGGGATGLGIAVDAATRDYRTLLLEGDDFGKGTSSRSTKLIHGGVRYLKQGNLTLVMEALRERGILFQNAPLLVHPLAFVVPAYSWWEGPFYGVGLKLYQFLAGRLSFGASRWLSKQETLRRIPTLEPNGLRGGVLYYDGQFDDGRLLLHLALTAVRKGAAILNYAPVTDLIRSSNGTVTGVVGEDRETGQTFRAEGRIVINATGPFVDSIRKLAKPTLPNLVSPSQGAHIVLDRSFLPGDTAIMVPRTRDGRLMFAIPWLGHTLVGTTDSPVETASLEPVPMDREIEFILETARPYLARKPTRSDILSAFAGIRPLVQSQSRQHTSSLSREHSIISDCPGLLSITGGKWTTYRRMAEDCVTRAADLAGLPPRDSRTKDLPLTPPVFDNDSSGDSDPEWTDTPERGELIRNDPKWGELLHPLMNLCAADIIRAARHEMARTVEDALARRQRALFLNARAAVSIAPKVAALMAAELGKDQHWQEQQVQAFEKLARNYLVKDNAAGAVNA